MIFSTACHMSTMPLLSALLLCLPLIAGAGDPDARGGGDATLAAAAFGRREGLAALLTDEAQVRRRRRRRASPRMLFLVWALVECEIASYVHEPGTRHLFIMILMEKGESLLTC